MTEERIYRYNLSGDEKWAARQAGRAKKIADKSIGLGDSNPDGIFTKRIIDDDGTVITVRGDKEITTIDIFVPEGELPPEFVPTLRKEVEAGELIGKEEAREIRMEIVERISPEEVEEEKKPTPGKINVADSEGYWAPIICWGTELADDFDVDDLQWMPPKYSTVKKEGVNIMSEDMETVIDQIHAPYIDFTQVRDALGEWDEDDGGWNGRRKVKAEFIDDNPFCTLGNGDLVYLKVACNTDVEAEGTPTTGMMSRATVVENSYYAEIFHPTIITGEPYSEIKPATGGRENEEWPDKEYLIEGIPPIPSEPTEASLKSTTFVFGAGVQTIYIDKYVPFTRQRLIGNDMWAFQGSYCLYPRNLDRFQAASRYEYWKNDNLIWYASDPRWQWYRNENEEDLDIGYMDEWNMRLPTSMEYANPTWLCWDGLLLGKVITKPVFEISRYLPKVEIPPIPGGKPPGWIGP